MHETMFETCGTEHPTKSGAPSDTADAPTAIVDLAGQAAMNADDLLEMKDIVKEFNGVKALDGINLRVRRGEVVGLCGENGAGKSTLMRVLSAVYPHGTWQGQILWQGAPLEAKSPRETEAAGIVIVHQEVALVPHLSVAENIFMGNEIRRPGGVMDYEAMFRQSQALMAEFKMDDVNVALPVHHYGSGHQQLFGIARALNKRAKLLILDEPTSSLTHAETARLLELIRSLKRQGVACVLISHKLDEISAVCDTVSVIRDGTHVATRAMRDTDAKEIIALMVGRELNGRFPRKTHPIGEVVFEARHITCFDADDPQRKRVDDVSFQLRRGEILGVAGLVGAGRTELATALFGCYAGRYHAELWLEGRPIVVDSPQAAVAQGLCLVPEDRKRHGIVPALGIGANITLAALGQFAPHGVIDDAAELAEIRRRMARMRIKAATPELPIEALSGGNQQKGVLSKMLLPNPKVLILDEPTRGIDVGAKYEIYTLMTEWVRQGMSILMISSELPEILGISDRVLVIGNGRLRGDFVNDGLTQAQLIGAALGQPDAPPAGGRPNDTGDPA